MGADEAQNRHKATPRPFEDYVLVQRGLLRPSLVFELLFMSIFRSKQEKIIVLTIY
jgi:hypothetical protein